MKYVEAGVEELDEERLPRLLHLKYRVTADAIKILGGVERILSSFFDF